MTASPPVPLTPAPGWFPGTTPAEVADERVTVVPYTVERDGDRWFADIEIALPRPSYAPFVQLALVRYQPDSVRGMAVSPVTLADPVQLPPDRRLVIEREGGGVRITLTGTGPQPVNRMEIVLEEADGAGTVSDLTELAADPTLRVAAWRPAPGAAVTSDGAPAFLTLPPGTAALRLRVREVERLDAPASEDTPIDLRERTVFLDVVALPQGWRPV
jgi:hypothetical protein